MIAREQYRNRARQLPPTRGPGNAPPQGDGSADESRPAVGPSGRPARAAAQPASDTAPQPPPVAALTSRRRSLFRARVEKCSCDEEVNAASTSLLVQVRSTFSVRRTTKTDPP